MKLKFAKLNNEMFDQVFLALRTCDPQSPLVSYETPFGTMTLPMTFLALAKDVSVTRRGKLDIRYQLMPDQKKLLKTIIKEVVSNSEVRKDLEVAMRSLITKCVALDTPSNVTSQLPNRYHPIKIQVGK